MIKTRLLKLLHHSSQYILAQIILQWLGLLGQIGIIFIVGDLIKAFQQDNVTFTAFSGALWVIILLIAFQLLCQYFYDQASFLASVDVKRVLRGKIYAKLLDLGTGYSARIASAEAVQLATEGVESLETYFGKYLSQFAYALLAPLTLFAVLLHINAPAAIVLLCAVPLIPIVIMVVMLIAKKILDKYFGIYYGLADTFLEKMQGMTTLKTYQADQQAEDDIASESEHFRQITMKVLTMQLLSTFVMDLIAYGGAASGMIVTLNQLRIGHLDLRGALILILLSAEFFLPMRKLGSYFHIGMNGMKASDQIFAFLDLPSGPTGQEDLPAEALDYEIKNLAFAYPDDPTRLVLSGLSLSIPAKGFISLVGLSGSGKSTLAAILSGRLRAYQGQVLLGGLELSQVKESSLLRQVTAVGFDSYLFKGTVRDNLLMASPASDQRLRLVLEEVKLWDFLESRGGLEAQITAKGSNLSGGQRQRLAIARALLHDSPVYIFDEATSNIDLESESAIMEVIKKLAHDKTVILISHRLANVVGSDQIFFLKDGKIAEHGRHWDLMHSRGAYAALYAKQAALENYSKEVHS
ncbi:ABC transporter ATP-binding protein/permease [Lactobacillus porci]|uniref:ABC transporter ATP-binding protein/permease n=1 Tax=Lactobacillus porci TaxID=2012477 RepID=UPI0039913277